MADHAGEIVNSKIELCVGQGSCESGGFPARERKPKYLLLASDESAQGVFSGYTRLSKHIPEFTTYS